MYELNTVLVAFGLTLLAGLATGLGSFIAFFAKKTNTKFLSIALGFSAGVMIYVSFVEIFNEAKISLVKALGLQIGSWITVASFFGGMMVIAIIDRLIPSFENCHEIHHVEELKDKKKAKEFKKLYRVGILTAVAIAIHNFPEGIATFASALSDPALGVAIAIAIAIHNIPEGIAVSIPIYYATGSRKKALILSFLSGFAEPLGALIGYLILMRFLTPTVFGILLSSIAGVMIFISFDELLPTAREYGESHLVIYGLVGGMVMMAVSLLLFI